MSRFWLAGVAVGLIVGYVAALLRLDSMLRRERRRWYAKGCEDCSEYGLAYPTGHPSKQGLYGRKERSNERN